MEMSKSGTENEEKDLKRHEELSFNAHSNEIQMRQKDKAANEFYKKRRRAFKSKTQKCYETKINER